MPSSVFIDYLRHGMPVGGRRYRGQIDDPLSETGWRQMRAATRARRDGEGWTRILSSPLLRCLDFAREIAADAGLSVHVDERLREVGFGQWEGLSGAQIDARWPDARRLFYRDPIKHRPEGAEPLSEFYARCASVWDELEGSTTPGERVLVVCHAGVIRASLAHVLGTPLERMYRMQVANASMTRVQLCDERPPQVLFHGREVQADD